MFFIVLCVLLVKSVTHIVLLHKQSFENTPCDVFCKWWWHWHRSKPVPISIVDWSLCALSRPKGIVWTDYFHHQRLFTHYWRRTVKGDGYVRLSLCATSMSSYASQSDLQNRLATVAGLLMSAVSVLCMYWVCTVYVLCMYRVCTVYALCMYRACTVYVPCMCRVWGMHCVRIMYVLCMFCLCSVYVPCEDDTSSHSVQLRGVVSRVCLEIWSKTVLFLRPVWCCVCTVCGWY